MGLMATVEQPTEPKKERQSPFQRIIAAGPGRKPLNCPLLRPDRPFGVMAPEPGPQTVGHNGRSELKAFSA